MSLELDQATMQRLGHLVADHVARHLASLRDQPASRVLSRADAERLVATPPPAAGQPVEALLETLTERVFPYHAREPHPGFLGYVQGCPTFPAILGDWLATGYNFFAGAWGVSSGPTMLEVTVLEWFRQWLGLPPGTGGLLTSGGSTANLMAVIAARHAVAGDDPSLLPRLTVYASDQAHSSLIRAAWIAGIPRANVRILPSDAEWQLQPALVEQAITADRAAGLHPLMILATAGTTNTGATDPLPELGRLARHEGLTLHVDGAYGGFAALSVTGRVQLGDLSGVDSLSLDPHKWLYVPFECGSLLVRDPERLRAAFHILPDYLRDLDVAGGEVNFADYGEQLTRYNRALKVWMGVSAWGTDALAREIEGGIHRAELAAELVSRSDLLELVSPARLGITCFRPRRPGATPAELDALTQRALETINRTAHFFISTTRLSGRQALRICCCGWRTTDADIARLVSEAEAAVRG